MDIQSIVTRELKAAGADAATLDLWKALSETYEKGGPEAVKEFLAERVKAAKKRASKEAREMIDIAGAVAKGKPSGRK